MSASLHARAAGACDTAVARRRARVTRLHGARAHVTMHDSHQPSSSAPSATANVHRHQALSRRNASKLACNGLPQHHVYFFGSSNDEPDYEYTVAKLQVALFGDIPKLQAGLDKMADRDTSDEWHLYQLLRDTSRFLGDRLEYCAYGEVRNKGCVDIDEAEAFFSRASTQERAKFREETLSNFDGTTRTRTLEGGKDDMLDTWLCLTLLVAIEADIKFPKPQNLIELKECLDMLRALHPDDVIAVELLWTPQASGDALTRDQLLADYPSLVTLT